MLCTLKSLLILEGNIEPTWAIVSWQETEQAIASNRAVRDISENFILLSLSLISAWLIYFESLYDAEYYLAYVKYATLYWLVMS